MFVGFWCLCGIGCGCLLILLIIIIRIVVMNIFYDECLDGLLL